MKVNWPTAAVLCVFLAGYFALQYAGKLPPWMADLAAAVGMWLLATMRGLWASSAQTSKTPPETPAAKIPPLAVILMLAGCGAGTPTPLEQAEVADYGSAQIMCARLASSPSDSDRCAGAVRAYWCGDAGPLHAAGACSYDGGSHVDGQ